MPEKINWGIVGPGKIARDFVSDLQLVEDANIKAVGSRNLDRARAFGSEFKIECAYGSYDDLINDDSIDIVYIATPHDSHAELSIKALESGRAVLVEKPVALNAQQARQMIAASRQAGTFLMEAFWSRFNPAIREVIDRVRAGDIGDVKYVNADFSFRVEADESSRMLNIDLGGGSLLDMGVYPVFLAYVMLGVPSEIEARSKFHATGADLQTAMLFDYPNAQALIYSSFASQSNMTATISGTEGRFTINPIWHETDSYSLHRNYDPEEERFERPRTGIGFYHEILECHECLRRGAVESEYWSHQNSLELIQIIDHVRALVGLEYPGDNIIANPTP